MTTLVFANGDIETYDWLSPYLERATVVIAADGGTRHLLHLGRRPDVIIGDLDSFPDAAHPWLEDEAVEVIIYPHNKDETDLELALLHALAHYEDPIQILGAFGGRFDQALGNVLLLAHPALRGRRVELVTEFQHAWLVSDQLDIHGRPGDKVSLIPLGGDVHVQETSGLKWPLQDEVLSIGPARGISNVMTEPLAHIDVTSGHLLCIHTDGTWQR